MSETRRHLKGIAGFARGSFRRKIIDTTDELSSPSAIADAVKARSWSINPLGRKNAPCCQTRLAAEQIATGYNSNEFKRDGSNFVFQESHLGPSWNENEREREREREKSRKEKGKTTSIVLTGQEEQALNFLCKTAYLSELIGNFLRGLRVI